MSNLSFIDQKYFEKELDMGGGYVLNLTNREFQRFIYDSLNFDVYQKYEYESKAKLLRRVINDYDNVLVGKLLMQFLSYKREHLSDTIDSENFRKCVDIANRLMGKKSSHTSTKTKSPSQQQNFNFQRSLNGLMKVVGIGNSQERGYAFEKYLNLLFDENNLEPRGSFKIVGEQIDGSFKFHNEIYLIEAKWTQKEITKSDLVIFNEKVNSKSGFTRGLFLSYSNYSKEALSSFGTGRKVSIILMTVQELFLILERRIKLTKVLEKKVRLLAEEGAYYKNFMNLGF